MSTVKAPVVIVGGGVVGLCTAYSLTQRGVRVCVINRQGNVPPASWGNAGLVVPALSAPLPAPGVIAYGIGALVRPASPLRISPRPDPRRVRWLLAFARNCTESAHAAGFEATASLADGTPALYDNLAKAGVEFAMWTRGLTFVATDRAAAEAELAHLRPLSDHGYELPDQLLEGDDLRAAEPALSSAVRAGFHIADERHVDPPTLLAGLRRWLEARGVPFVDGRARRCVLDGGGVTGVVVGGSLVPAQAVVLAAGAWTSSLAAQLGCRIPLQGGKGYSFSTEVPSGLGRPLYLIEARTAVTPFGAHARVAGAMDLDGLRPRLRGRRLRAVHAAAGRYLGCGNLPIRQPWAGLRPMTPDGLPVIGRLPTTRNAYVATGHAMLGLTLGPASGERLADLIVSGQAPAVLKPFGPERFG